MWTPATVANDDVGAALRGMWRPNQNPVPAQPLTTTINSADRTTLMTMEPRQPNRFEKKKNT